MLIFVDGASSGNPGPSGIGIVMCEPDGRVVKRYGKHIGFATNNEAEYLSLMDALDEALKMGVEVITVYSDSELLVNQILGNYKTRKKRLKNYLQKLNEKINKFKVFTISHIKGEKNPADVIAKKYCAPKK